ncbi:hypothetical protein O1611_g6074 [Lasiodiplodia mahajangana]|uniref:Uncharacterized protein n=1 Tax=Lasiodiplodia mahajangana TaxID=1108764 RepID=A0ACC2JJF2_9PEZI|nr:hypothetical protein O1611_g6074 [Lasiodiplodia mahajangana]
MARRGKYSLLSGNLKRSGKKTGKPKSVVDVLKDAVRRSAELIIPDMESGQEKVRHNTRVACWGVMRPVTIGLHGLFNLSSAMVFACLWLCRQKRKRFDKDHFKMPGATLPTAEQAAWMLSHPEDSLVANLIACGTIALIAATLSITLRLLSRKIARGRLYLDISDWFAVMAWIFYVIYISAFVSVTRYGGGKHVVFVTNPRLLGIVRAPLHSIHRIYGLLARIKRLPLTIRGPLKLYIAQENFYAATSALLKFSILSLYRELFRTSRTFCLCTWAVTALVTEWFVQVVLATNLQCIPISASWDPSVRGTCINYGIEALVAYLINISTDFIILSMPIPLILKLQVSKPQKWRLIISFATGGSACIVSLVQLAYITRLGNAPDTSWSIVPSSLLGTVELMVGFFAASIATYGPLYRFVFPCSSRRHKTGRNPRVGARSTSGDIPNTPRRGIIVSTHIELTGYSHKVNDESELLASC